MSHRHDWHEATSVKTFGRWIEALRQPLESGTVLIARAERRIELPARFQLVAAMNPCPCGYLGHGRVPCSCPPSHVARYRRRISGPLLDRVELRIEVSPPTLDDLAPLGSEVNANGQRSASEPSERELRLAIDQARSLQRSRGLPARNVDLDGAALERLVPVEGEARALLSAAAERRELSARALQALRRVARTVADLEGSESVAPSHFAQALALRAPI
jgi:magnesium chelatase family protein